MRLVFGASRELCSSKKELFALKAIQRLALGQADVAEVLAGAAALSTKKADELSVISQLLAPYQVTNAVA